MNVSATGVVYRNPSPHVCSRHAYFPSLVVRPDGTLFVAMDIGSAFEAVDVRSYGCHSSDGGATWSRPQLIFEPDTSTSAVSTSTRIGQSSDGSLIGWSVSFARPNTEIGLVNPDTDGFVPMQFATTRSTDGGHTWTAPRPATLPTDWREFEVCSPIVQTAPQRWVVPASPVKRFDGATAPAALPAGLAWTSSDAGQSWTGHVRLFDAGPAGLSALEQKLTRLSDGRWLAVCWSIDATGRTVPNRYAIADETAARFGDWASTGINGETCTPIGLPDGRVLCVYRSFTKPGLWGHVARINGDAWAPEQDLCLWDGTNAPRSATAERFTELREMKDLRFGYPSVALLPSGEVMIAFWCVESCVSNIRWIRVSRS